MVKLGRLSGIRNLIDDPSGKICIPSKKEDIN